MATKSRFKSFISSGQGLSDPPRLHPVFLPVLPKTTCHAMPLLIAFKAHHDEDEVCGIGRLVVSSTAVK
eukprot:scaffold28_cov155-Amphora_coffeaeformis.AAC.8